jgi:hypothetical protein
MKSDKLKSFNIFQLKTYESNLAMKLRLVIRVLGEVKRVYQLHVMVRSEMIRKQQ